MKNVIYIVLSLLVVSCSTAKDTKETTVPVDRTPKKEAALRLYFIEGNSEEVKGNFDRAIELYKECLKIDQENDAVHYALAGVYGNISDLTSAVYHAEKAVKLDQENIWYKLKLAQFYHYTTQYADAAKVYKEVVAYSPEPKYIISLAETQIFANDYDGAIKSYQILLDKSGPTPELVNQMFNLYQELGKRQQGIELVESVVKDNPNQIEYMGLLANIYEEQGDLDKAKALYSDMVVLDPDNGQIHMALFSHQWYKGEKSGAFKSLHKAFTDESLSIDMKMEVLLDLYDASDEDPTLMSEIYPVLDSLITAHPDSPKGYSIYGDYLLRDGREEDARDMFSKALEVDAERYIIWSQVMFLDVQIGDMKGLLDHSKAATERFPNQPGAFYFNGLANFRLGNLNDAEESLEYAKSIVIDNEQLLKEICQTLGDVHYKLGNNQQAYKNYDKALEILPDNAYILNNYAYYLTLDNTRLEDAEEMIKKALKSFPEQASYLDTYGWLLFRKGSYQEAYLQLRKAMDNGGDKNPVMLEHLGDILFHLDKKSEAIENWKKAKELGSESKTLDRKIQLGKYVE